MTAQPRPPLDRDTRDAIMRAVDEAWQAGASGGRLIFGKRGGDHKFVREHVQAIPGARDTIAGNNR